MTAEVSVAMIIRISEEETGVGGHSVLKEITSKWIV
jgi:hypothetical protein